MGNVELAPVPATEFQSLRQGGRLLDHLHRIGEQNAGLIALGRCGVYLRASLAVRYHAVQADSARQWRLAVTLALLNVGAAESALTVRLLPAEQRADDESLRRMQLERLAVELALRQLQHSLEEPERGIRCITVKVQAALLSLFQVKQVTAAGVADVRASDDPPGHYVGRVLFSSVGCGRTRLPDLRRPRRHDLPWSHRPESRRASTGSS